MTVCLNYSWGAAEPTLTGSVKDSLAAEVLAVVAVDAESGLYWKCH